MMPSLSIFLSLISLSTLISSISCAGSSPTLVDPNNVMLPRVSDFKECSEPISCDGLYYCGNGASCYARSCRDCISPRGVYFPDYTMVPSCVETYQVSLTAAIIKEESPINVMRSTADACRVSSQMVILNTQYSRKTAAEIVNTIAPDMTWMAQYYTAYDIRLGFFYEASPDQPIYAVTGKFRTQLLSDSASILDTTASAFSINRAKGALVNTSNFQIIPTTFAIQRCSDGTAVTGSEKCPPADPALVSNTASTSTSTTTRLLTIILPIIGGIVLIALIIAAVVIVRRRQANKVMRQTIQHTEPTVEVAMA